MGKKNRYEDIDKFLEEVEINVIPEEFITAACVTNLDGDEYLVSFDEAAEIFENGSLEDQGILAVRAIINMREVRETVYQLSKQCMRATKSKK